MAIEKRLQRPDTLQSVSQSLSRPQRDRIPNPKPDINSFVITRLDGNFNTIDSLQLEGTNLPHQPFLHPVSQQVIKHYYAGGTSAGRVPTIQVLGSMEEDVILNGRFKATKLGSSARRKDPLVLSNSLEDFTRSGNLCKFQLGSWIAYGYIVRYDPSYKTDSDIHWSMTLSITTLQDPQGAVTDRVFGRVAEDRVVSEAQISELVNATRVSIENSGYIEKVDIKKLASVVIADISESELDNLSEDQITQALNSVYPIRNYIEDLREFSPVGEYIQIGETYLNRYKEVFNVVEGYLDAVDDFQNSVDQGVNEINRVFLSYENVRSRLYRTLGNLSSDVSTLSAGLGTFSRLAAWNPFNELSNMINTVMRSIKTQSDDLFSQLEESVQDTYSVRQGDTLQSISTNFYGDWTRWEDIKNANNLDDVDLSEDQILVIPR